MRRLIRYRLPHFLWTVWHVKLRECFGHYRGVWNGRPWWHLCCNGNAGGWRTKVCDFLEFTWRDEELRQHVAEQR